MKPVICVENISKKYNRGANEHFKYGALEIFNELVGAKRNAALREGDFYAVDDVSFNLYPGESIALVGRNGCGKSTTLRMLAGLIKPDAGRIIVDGKVQALIALGAGFNPALSGRDNIRNAAAVAGMGKRETEKAFGEIIEFAELGDFIDSPVSYYSSGMYARLGFSVAIHLNPDIMLIDEILGVGDYAFQNKCFKKMQELKSRGITIVLVSHSHTKVVQMCERAIWLERGRIRKIGNSNDVVNEYLSYLDTDSSASLSVMEKKEGEVDCSRLYGAIYNDSTDVDEVNLELFSDGEIVESVFIHSEVEFRYCFKIKRKVDDLNVTLNILREDGLLMTAISTLNGHLLIKHGKKGPGTISCCVKLRDINLNPGKYVITMPIHEGQAYLYRDVVKRFVVKKGKTMTWGLVDLKVDYECRPV